MNSGKTNKVTPSSDNGEEIRMDEIYCELTLPEIFVSPPAYPGLIRIGAFPLSLRDSAVTPRLLTDSIRRSIGRVCRDSSPVKITSLSDNADTLVIKRRVVPELAKSIGFVLELCNFPPVPTTSKHSSVLVILAPKLLQTLIEANVSSE